MEQCLLTPFDSPELAAAAKKDGKEKEAWKLVRLGMPKPEFDAWALAAGLTRTERNAYLAQGYAALGEHTVRKTPFQDKTF